VSHTNLGRGEVGWVERVHANGNPKKTGRQENTLAKEKEYHIKVERVAKDGLITWAQTISEANKPSQSLFEGWERKGGITWGTAMRAKGHGVHHRARNAEAGNGTVCNGGKNPQSKRVENRSTFRHLPFNDGL